MGMVLLRIILIQKPSTIFSDLNIIIIIVFKATHHIHVNTNQVSACTCLFFNVDEFFSQNQHLEPISKFFHTLD